MSAMDKDSIRFAKVGEPRLLIARVPAEYAEADEDVYAFATPIMARAGGFMVCMPVNVFAGPALVAGTRADDEADIGPSFRHSAPLVEELEDGSEGLTGFETEFILLDLSDTALSWFSEYDPVTDSTRDIIVFMQERPEGLPEIQAVLKLATEWADESSLSRANFYSAREEQEQEAAPKVRTRKAPALKRPTVAGLADQVATMAAQMNSMMTLMQEAQTQKVTATLATVPSPTRRELEVPQMPASGRGWNAGSTPATPKNLAHLVGPPPKVRHSLVQFQEQEQKDEPVDPFAPAPDPVVAALSQQSLALTTLVSHLTGQSGDPMIDLAMGSSSQGTSTTRGVARRERMISSLATGTSNFWIQFQQQMSRRMHPSRAVPKTEEELRDQGLSMYSYLERFGGYKGQRDLGLITWIVAAAVDAAAAQNFSAVKEHLALLVCSLEQAAIDGSWDTAYLISLAPDPPQQLFQERMSSMSGLRVFAPIMPGEWAAVHLSYLKELDLLMTKKSELKKTQKPDPKGQNSDQTESPKRPRRYPKKAKASSEAE